MSEEEKAEVVSELDKFIGSSKVVKTETRDNGFVHYETEDGRGDTVKPDQYANMVKELAYDDQLIMVYKWSPVSAQILAVLLQYDMPMSDMNFVTKQVQQSIVDNYEKSVAKMFKRQITDHVRLSQVDEVLKTTTDVIKE